MGTRSHLIRTAFAAALLAVLVVVPETPALAIHRGEDADIAAYPFMVSLRLAGTPDSPRCGGTLIEPDIVLTAGHCVAGVPQGGIVVVVGADIPAWPDAPKVATLGHAVPETTTSAWTTATTSPSSDSPRPSRPPRSRWPRPSPASATGS